MMRQLRRLVASFGIVAALVLPTTVAKPSVTPPGPVTSVPGWSSPLPSKHYAGHLVGNASCGAYPFFWLAESMNDPKNDPIVVWYELTRTALRSLRNISGMPTVYIRVTV